MQKQQVFKVKDMHMVMAMATVLNTVTAMVMATVMAMVMAERNRIVMALTISVPKYLRRKWILLINI